MPLPENVVKRLVSGNLKRAEVNSRSDYLEKIPTLDETVIPDSTPMWNVSASGSEVGIVIHDRLNASGLTKSQRTGMSNLLEGFVKIDGCELNVGDIRALSEDELIKLRGEFDTQTPSIDSVRKVKRLLG